MKWDGLKSHQSPFLHTTTRSNRIFILSRSENGLNQNGGEESHAHSHTHWDKQSIVQPWRPSAIAQQSETNKYPVLVNSSLERPVNRFGYIRAKHNSCNRKSKSFHSSRHFAVFVRTGFAEYGCRMNREGGHSWARDPGTRLSMLCKAIFLHHAGSKIKTETLIALNSHQGGGSYFCVRRTPLRDCH